MSRFAAGGVPRAVMAAALVALGCAGARTAPRGPTGALQEGTFPDRPVAWNEHDSEDVPVRPKSNDLQDLDITLLVRDSLVNESDRLLAGEGRVRALDVNALDEVPCSTWFCPRNHRRAMTPEALAAGPEGMAPPRLPLRITRGKDTGASAGFQAKDADGRRYLIKFDPLRHTGMATGAEVIGTRLFHGAGYNVPGSFIVDLGPDDLIVDPSATFSLYGVQKRPMGEAHVRTQLAKVGRTPEGKLRAAAVSWLGGDILGAFDMIGVRADDPNDRIAHQHRRSLRASFVMYAWLGVLDASAINTLDSYVNDDGRRFVRHYIIDFGAGLGSASAREKGPHEGQSHIIEVGRTLASFFSLGLYRRPFQDQREAWLQHASDSPSVGWFPDQPFDPRGFRPSRKIPAHQRLTRSDAYWGAKVVTAFSDAQLAAVVGVAGLPADGAVQVERALRERRDAIGRTYLRDVTAVESVRLSESGAEVCFLDLAIARGYAAAPEVSYGVEIATLAGDRLLSALVPAAGPSTCVPVGPLAAHPDYRVVQITTELGGQNGGASARAASVRLHLRWRHVDRRLALVGVERDE